MDTRAALLAVLALSVALAGCDGTTCPAGETPIDEVGANAEEVSVGGSIQEFSASRIVVTDGTGQALLVSLDGYDTDAAGVGDCIDATGEVVGDGSDAEGGTYDVVIRTTSVELRR